MYEAIQERPIYWDNVPHHKLRLSQRSGDWRMAHKRVAKEFQTVTAAEAYAKRILAQRPGCPVDIVDRGNGQRWRHDRVAVVSRDALGRTWTDILTTEPLL